MQIKTILYPTDFSNSARAAMDHAVSLAQDYNASLTLLYVMQNIIMAGWDNVSPHYEADLMEDLQRNAWAAMDKWGAEVSSKVKNVEKMVVNGVPFVKIIRTAREKKLRQTPEGLEHGKIQEYSCCC